MTQEQQDKLRRALYNAKFTTDAEDDNPFVGIYFNNLLDIIHDFPYSPPPQWISVEERKPEVEGSYFCCDDDGFVGELIWTGYCWKGDIKDSYNVEGITHWMPMPQPPQGKEE